MPDFDFDFFPLLIYLIKSLQLSMFPASAAQWRGVALSTLLFNYVDRDDGSSDFPIKSFKQS